MTLKRITAYVRDGQPHTGAMYIVLGLAAAACALRSRRQLPPKQDPTKCSRTVYKHFSTN
jgi:hypothetical protein